MADEGGEKVLGRKIAGGVTAGEVPTGADLASEGSSVETEGDVATREEIPSTEEILRLGKEARRKGRRPRKELIGGAPEERLEQHPVPHDKGRMQDVE